MMNQIPVTIGRPLLNNVIPAGSYWFTDGQRALPQNTWQQLGELLGNVGGKSDRAYRVAALRHPGLYTHEWRIADHARFIFVPSLMWHFYCPSFNTTLHATGDLAAPKGMILLDMPCGLVAQKAWKLELPEAVTMMFSGVNFKTIRLGPYVIS